MAHVMHVQIVMLNVYEELAKKTPDLLESRLLEDDLGVWDLESLAKTSLVLKEFFAKREIYRKLEKKLMPNNRWRILATEIAMDMLGEIIRYSVPLEFDERDNRIFTRPSRTFDNKTQRWIYQPVEDTEIEIDDENFDLGWFEGQGKPQISVSFTMTQKNKYFMFNAEGGDGSCSEPDPVQLHIPTSVEFDLNLT